MDKIYFVFEVEQDGSSKAIEAFSNKDSAKKFILEQEENNANNLSWYYEEYRLRKE